jgi:hypothetical protein
MLAQRPQARAFKIEDLMQEIRRGRLRIPSFQRRLAWDRNDARMLVDSLYRGYPVGTLLLWEAAAPAGRWEWGALELESQGRTDALWVVDGQQRLVSLARILLVSDDAGDDFELHFDLDNLTLVYPTSVRQDDPARWLPLNLLIDSERLFEWLYTNEPSAERRARALQMGKNIREYDIPAYIVRSDDEATLQEIFGRLNSRGKHLTAAEVFDALHGTRNGQKTETSLQHLAQVLAHKRNFGRVDEDILHRLVRVMYGADVIQGGRSDPLRLGNEQANALFADAEAAALRVIDFLRQDAGITHFQLMPYGLPLVTLGQFFHLYPQPLPRSRDLLVRWLWRGALSGLHRGDSVTARTTLDQIKPGDEEGSVQRMLAMVGPLDSRFSMPDAKDQFNFRFAASKMQALALLELKPRHIQTGQLLDFGEVLDEDKEQGKVPFVPVISKGRVNEQIRRSVANRLAHPNLPGGIRRWVLNANSDTLASHAISVDAMLAFAAGDLQGFLEERAKVLQPHIDAVLARYARWGAIDRPSIQSMVLDDEESLT